MSDDVSQLAIPRRLIYFWHQPSEIPDSILWAIEQTRLRHPDYEIVFGNDQAICQFLKHRGLFELLFLYRNNQIPASRSDLARLILLFAFGGIYLDAAMEIQGSFDNWIHPANDLVLVRRDDLPRYQYGNSLPHVVNGLMASKSKNALILAALNQAILHLRSGQYNHDVWHATGANCLNLHLSTYCQNYQILYKNFSQLKDDFFVYRRDPTVSNVWRLQESRGIHR